ncbi:MAG: tRNA lysidine(34) synthetase TilS, partial [Nitrospirae bacterium]|nr:tRNA lysidine(34) synthetase TilS [Nitrospirota bacterium]
VSDLLPGLVLKSEKGLLHLDQQRLGVLPRPLQRRLIRLALQHLQGEVRRLPSDSVETVFELLERSDTKSADQTAGTLPGGVRVSADLQKVVFESRPKAPTPEAPLWRTELRLPGETEVPWAGIRVETRILDGASPADGGDPMTRYFEWDRVSPPLEVRNRRSGDRFCPEGMGGRHQKLKQFMIDRKIPRPLREDIPILASPEGILWIIGWRADERFRVSESTRKVIEVCLMLKR